MNYGRRYAAAASPDATPNKYALLVGISKYSRGNTKPDFDWWDLHTKGDLEILADSLIRRFQFKPENITVICDEPVTVGGKMIPPVKPTAKAIADAFKTGLTDRVGKGDIAFFHYSGHGNQAPDDDKHGPNPVVGDEADGMDETLIPADYASQLDPSRDIRDDSISEWLTALNAKGPANVTITLDSCHSGTATRGDEVIRGSHWKGDPIDPKRLAKRDDSVADFITEKRGRGAETSGQNYVFISAASPLQTSKEQVVDGVSYGKFTYNLVKAMETAGPATTYRDLFENVSSTMTRDQRAQTPQIEGKKLDQVVFGAGALPVERYVPVQVSGNNVYLRAGHLQGMTAGSKFALYPAGAKGHEEGKEIAKVTIERVNPASSVIKLPDGVDPEKLKMAARAFEIEHNYSDTLKVAVRGVARGGSSNVDAVLKELGLIQNVSEAGGDWNVLIRPPDKKTDPEVAGDFKGLVLQRHDGSIIKAVPEGAGMTNAIAETLKGEAMWQLVKSLDETQDDSIKDSIELSIVPVKVDVDDVSGELLGMTDLKTPITERGGKKQVHACVLNSDDHCKPNTGEFAQLEIKNTSDRPLWVTVLNLRSDGKIGPAFPIDNSDNKIAPGTTFRVPYPFRFRAPYGEESFRAIVTANQTDFSGLIDPTLRARGNETERGRNAASSPLGTMISLATVGKRGDPMAPPASWATAFVTYYVVPPDTK